MGRLRPVLIGALIIANAVIFFGTPFRDSMGGLPRSFRETFGELGSDPAGTALPVVRLLLGLAILAATIDLLRGYRRRPRSVGEPVDSGPNPVGTTGSSGATGSAVDGPAAGATGFAGSTGSAGSAELTDADLSGQLEPASMAVRDRWHDLPDWRWVLAEDQQVREDDDHPAWSLDLPDPVAGSWPAEPGPTADTEPTAGVEPTVDAEPRAEPEPAVESEAAPSTPAAGLTTNADPIPEPVETFGGLIDRFTVTIQSTIDVDEAVRRIEVHDALRDLTDDHDALDHRRAVVAALASGQHWPFHGTSAFHVSSIRSHDSEASFFDGLFVLRDRAVPAGELGEIGNDRYLVTAGPMVTAVLERDPDLVVAVVDHLGPAPADTAAEAIPDPAGSAPPVPAAGRSPGPASSAPQSQGAVFRLQVAEGERKSEANTRGDRHIVSVARIRRLHLSDQAPSGLPGWSPLAAKPADVVPDGAEAAEPPPASETEG